MFFNYRLIAAHKGNIKLQKSKNFNNFFLKYLILIRCASIYCKLLTGFAHFIGVPENCKN